MLEAIREKAQGFVATLIVGVIIVIFGVWGIQSYIEGGSQVNVATVDGVEISVDAYRSALDRQRQYMYQLLGNRADSRMFDNPAFKTRVVESMIDEVLVSQHAQDHGYRVSDARLAETIHAVTQFHNQNGKFDVGVYQSTLRSAGLSAAGYEQSTREDLVADQVRSGFAQAAFVTDAEIDRLVRLEMQQRSFAYVVVSPEQFKDKVTPGEEEVKSYYSAHPEEFKIPALVRVDYIRLAAADLAKGLSISEEELRKLYEEEVDRYVTPEERQARHVLVAVPAGAKDEEVNKALAQAQDLRKQIVSGADFAAVARKHSQDPGSATKGGDLGYVRRGAFVAEFEDALFSMKRGEVSQPILTKYGYHVIKLEAVKPEVRKTFEQAKAELESLARTRKAEEQFFEAAQTFQNLVYEHPESLQAAADALGLKIERSDWFARAGGAGIASEPKVVEAAFGPEVYAGHRNSDAIEMDPTTVVSVRVTDRQEERVRDLAEVRAQIIERLRQQAAEQEAVRASEALLARVNDGRDLEAEAKSSGAKFVADKTISRRKTDGVDSQLVTAVFKTARPADKPVYGKVDLGKGGAVVFALKSVSDGDPKLAEPSVRQQQVQSLERRCGEGLFQAYLSGLRKNKSIKINQEQL